MRDWTKLRVFENADELVLEIYQTSTLDWPKSHQFGLTQQIQRAAVSVASNIVEGCSRSSAREYVRFIEIAYASACELQYQLSVARRLQFSTDMTKLEELESKSITLSRSLGAMIRNLAQSPEPRA